MVVLSLGVYFWHGRSCSWWQNMRRFVLGHLSANGELMVVWTPPSDSAPITLFLCPAVLTVWIPSLLIIPVVQRRNEYVCLCLIRFIENSMDANHAGSKLSSALFPGNGCETFGAHPIILRSCTKLLQMTRCVSPSTIPLGGLWHMTIMMHDHGYERTIAMTVIWSPIFVGKRLFL